MSRRGSANPEREPSTDQQFMFIDNTANRASISEAVRVHVMRRSHRTRRERLGHAARSQTHGDISFLRQETPTTQSQSSTPVPQQSGPPSHRVDEASSLSSIDWIQAVRTGLSDIPYRSVEDLESLAESYVQSVRLLEADVLELCLGDEVALRSFLALAAFQHCPGSHEAINIASARFEAGALEQLRNRVSIPGARQSDATMLAVLLLSRIEELKGSADSSLHHRKALRTLIHDRGGIRAVRVESSELCDILEDAGLDRPDVRPSRRASGS